MHISDGPLSTLQQDTARADLAKQVSQCFSSQLKLLTRSCLGAASVKGPCSLVCFCMPAACCVYQGLLRPSIQAAKPLQAFHAQ